MLHFIIVLRIIKERFWPVRLNPFRHETDFLYIRTLP